MSDTAEVILLFVLLGLISALLMVNMLRHHEVPKHVNAFKIWTVINFAITAGCALNAFTNPNRLVIVFLWLMFGVNSVWSHLMKKARAQSNK